MRIAILFVAGALISLAPRAACCPFGVHDGRRGVLACARQRPARSPIHRTLSLDTRNDAIRRALIMVHGTNRNADHHFETAAAAAFWRSPTRSSPAARGSAAGNCTDACRQRSELELPGDSWRSAHGRQPSDLTSFDFVDQILKKLANKSMFPNRAPSWRGMVWDSAWRAIDGDRVHDTLGVLIIYVVANPRATRQPRDRSPLTMRRPRRRRSLTVETVHTKFTYGPLTERLPEL
jgi:hypothetical protein